MKNFLKKLFLVFTVLLALVLIASLAGILWMRSGSVTPAKIAVLKRLPVPVAVVSSVPVWANEYFNRLDKLAPYRPGSMDSEAYQKMVFSRLMEEKAVDRIISANSVEKARPEISADPADGILQNWKAKQLTLQVWYNSKAEFNPEVHAKAESILKNIQTDGDFEGQASIQSQDPASKNLYGDLGYLEAKDILPEILSAVDSMKAGETKIVASRLGLHIIKLIGKDNLGQENGQRMHLKQIFLSESGFDYWLASEINKIKIIKLLNI